MAFITALIEDDDVAGTPVEGTAVAFDVTASNPADAIELSPALDANAEAVV